MKEQARNHVKPKLNESETAPAQPPPARSRESLSRRPLSYDGGRHGHGIRSPRRRPEAIVFAGDGQGISKWGRLLEKTDVPSTVPSTMIVGVHRLTDETLRLHEYSPGFAPERFAAHEKFFVEDVRRWTESRFGVALPAERTAVFGVSAGGELALALGLRHPHIYGAVFCASPGGGYKPPDVYAESPSPAPTLSLAPRSRSSSRTQADGADALRDAGCGGRHE